MSRLNRNFVVACLCCVCLGWSQAGLAQDLCGVRYKEPVFSNVTTTYGIPYSSACAEGQSTPSSLSLDFYEPVGDTLAARPLVITVFGGGFVSGSRDATDMVAYCEQFAKYGYVTASIDYRLISVFDVNFTSMVREAYIATQDLSAAIRFFKANSAYYRIDTNRVFLLGNSAGSIAILHEIFMTEDERPAATYNAPDLGPIHQSGSPSHFNYSPKVAGAVSQWGGVMDLDILDVEDYVPICMIHGMKDNIVPYDSGYCLSFSSGSMPFMYGSHTIARRFDEIGIRNYEFHPFEGESHCFYIFGFNTLIQSKFKACFNITRDFFYKVMMDQPFSVPGENRDELRVYPNPAADYVQVELPGAEITRLVLHDLQGRVVRMSEVTRGTVVLSVEGIPQGLYLLTVTDSTGRSVVHKLVVRG